MNSFKIIGLIGLILTLALNLVSLSVWKKASAVFFSDQWWSSWFPILLLWLVFGIIGYFGSKPAGGS